jgi:glycosyltransferase involved in cell wall biosynthesis
MSELEFSVVIPTRNRIEDLRRCLSAVAAQDFDRNSFEVIVCDDGSVEDITTVVEGARLSGLEIKHLKQEPRGPAAARNLGIRHARGRIVAMTDSDTVPDRVWLRKLSESFADNSEAVAVEGKVYADNEGEFDPLGEGPSNKTGGVFLTCNCAYRRDVLLQVGGFDETFPYPAYEDTELAAQARKVGPIVWQPEAVVIHPQRPLTLRSVLKKLRHWEYVLLMGYRYGYLAWDRYPVKHPRLRVAALSVFALPLAKFKIAAVWSRRKPSAAARLIAYGLIESFGALLFVVPKALLGSYHEKVLRRNYLN